jgi:hypothetical protein
VGVDLHKEAGEEAERFRGDRIDVDNGNRIEMADEFIIFVSLLGHSASSGLRLLAGHGLVLAGQSRASVRALPAIIPQAASPPRGRKARPYRERLVRQGRGRVTRI